MEYTKVLLHLFQFIVFYIFAFFAITISDHPGSTEPKRQDSNHDLVDIIIILVCGIFAYLLQPFGISDDIFFVPVENRILLLLMLSFLLVVLIVVRYIVRKNPIRIKKYDF